MDVPEVSGNGWGSKQYRQALESWVLEGQRLLRVYDVVHGVKVQEPKKASSLKNTVIKGSIISHRLNPKVWDESSSGWFVQGFSGNGSSALDHYCKCVLEDERCMIICREIAELHMTSKGEKIRPEDVQEYLKTLI